MILQIGLAEGAVAETKGCTMSIPSDRKGKELKGKGRSKK